MLCRILQCTKYPDSTSALDVDKQEITWCAHAILRRQMVFTGRFYPIRLPAAASVRLTE